MFLLHLNIIAGKYNLKLFVDRLNFQGKYSRYANSQSKLSSCTTGRNIKVRQDKRKSRREKVIPQTALCWSAFLCQ